MKSLLPSRYIQLRFRHFKITFLPSPLKWLFVSRSCCISMSDWGHVSKNAEEFNTLQQYSHWTVKPQSASESYKFHPSKPRCGDDILASCQQKCKCSHRWRQRSVIQCIWWGILKHLSSHQPYGICVLSLWLRHIRYLFSKVPSSEGLTGQKGRKKGL